MKEGWEAVIGLEVHVQLKTASKLFSASSAAFGEEPNANTDPVVLGLPGCLPVLNRQAVQQAGKAALALNLHTGLSPDYRGADTEFWALYDGRPDMVGATVHVCVKEVDAGPIFAKAPAAMHAGDDPFRAFARAVQTGAALYAEAV